MAGLFEDSAARRIMSATRTVEGDRRNMARAKNLRHKRSGSTPTEFTGTVAATSPSLTATVTKPRQGADPRTNPSDPLEQVPIVAELGLELEIGDEVWCVQNSDGTYSAIRLGEGPDPPVIVRFQLTEDLSLASGEAAAILLNDDGTATDPVTPIQVTDTNGHFQGLATYVGADGNNKLGFRGTAIKYTIPGPQERYYIVDIERVYPKILVTLTADIGTSAAGVDANYVKGYGNSYRVPSGSASGTVGVSNTDHFADGAKTDEKWVAFYDPDNDRYELVHGKQESGSTDIVSVWVNQTIPAAVLDDSTQSIIRGEGQGLLMAGNAVKVPNEAVDLLCESETDFRASSGEPIVVQARLEGGKYIILSDKDNRSIPGFTENSMQVLYHAAGEPDFKQDATDCESQALAGSLASDPWRESGFWN